MLSYCYMSPLRFNKYRKATLTTYSANNSMFLGVPLTDIHNEFPEGDFFVGLRHFLLMLMLSCFLCCRIFMFGHGDFYTTTVACSFDPFRLADPFIVATSCQDFHGKKTQYTALTECLPPH